MTNLKAQVKLDVQRVDQGDLDMHEQEFLDSLLQGDDQNLSKLIKSKTSPNDDIVGKYLTNAIHKIQTELDIGKLEIGDHNSTPIAKSKDRVAEINVRRKALEKQLGYLNTQLNSYVDSTTEDPSHPAILLPKQQHKKLIKKMFRLHQQFEELHKKHLREMEQKQLQEEEALKKEELSKIEKEKQQKRKKIQQNLNKLKAVQTNRKQFAEEAEKRFEEVRSKKFLHEKMVQKYENEVVLPTLEMKKKKLKEIREFRRPMSIDLLKNYEEEYINNKQAWEREKKQKQRMKVEQSPVKKYEPPARSKRLQRILEEEVKEKERETQEKKRAVQQKIERAQSYHIYLKQNFKPTIDEDKRRQIEERLQRQRSKVKTQKHDPKFIGLGYLEYSKQKHKPVSRQSKNVTMLESRNLTYREKSPESANVSSQSKATSLKPHNYLTTRDRKQYDEERKRKLERIIQNEELSKTEKVKELRAQAQRLTEMANRKNQLVKLKPSEDNEEEATQLLLASIKAKMGIIDLYKAQS